MLDAYAVKSAFGIYNIRSGSTYEEDSFITVIKNVEAIPLLIDSDLYKATYVDSKIEETSWESGYWVEWLIVKIDDQYFKLSFSFSSWDDGNDDIDFEVEEVRPVTKTITAYRQVPYEKEVTEYI